MNFDSNRFDVNIEDLINKGLVRIFKEEHNTLTYNSYWITYLGIFLYGKKSIIEEKEEEELLNKIEKFKGDFNEIARHWDNELDGLGKTRHQSMYDSIFSTNYNLRLTGYLPMNLVSLSSSIPKGFSRFFIHHEKIYPIFTARKKENRTPTNLEYLKDIVSNNEYDFDELYNNADKLNEDIEIRFNNPINTDLINNIIFMFYYYLKFQLESYPRTIDKISSHSIKKGVKIKLPQKEIDKRVLGLGNKMRLFSGYEISRTDPTKCKNQILDICKKHILKVKKLVEDEDDIRKIINKVKNEINQRDVTTYVNEWYLGKNKSVRLILNK